MQGCKHPKEAKFGCFWCVLEFGAIWEKPLFLFPLGHVTWRSEWRTELGKASHPIPKFVFSLQLVSLIRQSICIGLLQNFLIIVGKHAEIWNEKEIFIYLHPFCQGKPNRQNTSAFLHKISFCGKYWCLNHKQLTHLQTSPLFCHYSTFQRTIKIENVVFFCLQT